MGTMNTIASDLFKQFETSEAGLSDKEAEIRLQKYGENVLKVKKKKPLIVQFLKQFKDLMVIILIGAGTISFVAGEEKEAIAILVVVLLNAVIGFTQEYKAEKAIEALKKLMAHSTRVIRNGKEIIIESRFLVPGDIMILNEGDRIGGDGILFEINEITTQEAALTGESVPVSKDPQNKDMRDVFLGTLVAHGNGKAVITKTGMQTAFGRIAHLTAETKKEKSPLEKELHDIGIFVGKITLVISLILFLAGYFIQNQPIVKTLLFAAAIAVAAVPEGLPAIVTIALALGAQRLAKKNAIIKQLSSVETLGSTTVILSDKTGTLTENKMTVQEMVFDEYHASLQGVGYDPAGIVTFEYAASSSITLKRREELSEIKKSQPTLYQSLEVLTAVSTLCNNAKLIYDEQTKRYEIIGDPTEGSLLTLTEKLGFTCEEIQHHHKKIHEIPFDSTRKRMSVIVRKEETEKIYAYVKGAPDEVLAVCSHTIYKGKIVSLDEKKRTELLRMNEEMAKKALRVIGFAYKEISSQKDKYSKEEVENNLIFIGLVGMIDPPREQVYEAVELTKKAGIKVYIVTGDHGLTAAAIAEKIKLVDPQKGYQIITGQEFNNIGDNELIKLLKDRKKDIIFARVNPEHKLRIATALKTLGEVIAVTGDGVNDAPALKKADIGVAMGISGTDVSKEAANMVLADDSFSTIITAIEEGRTIYENLKKFIFYIFSSNVGEVAVVFSGILLGLPSPLSAIQILLINLGTDVLPALALGVDPPEKGIMLEPPRDPKERILRKKFVTNVFIIGITLAIIVSISYILMLIRYGWTWGQPLTSDDFIHEKGGTFAFVLFVLGEMVNTYNSRSQKRSVFQINPLRNLYLFGAVLISVIFTILIVEWSPLQKYIETTGLTLEEWGMAILLSFTILIPAEIYKWFSRRKTA